MQSWTVLGLKVELILGSIVTRSALAPHVTFVTSWSWQLVGLCWKGLQNTTLKKYNEYGSGRNFTKNGRRLPEKSRNGIISELAVLQVTRVIFTLGNYSAILKIIACQNDPRRSTGYDNQFSLILVYSIWFNQVRILSIIYLRLDICFVSVAAINSTYDDKKDCHNNSSEYIA